MKVILTADQLRDGVAQMARNIQDRFGNQPLTIIGVLTGSVVLLADLIRQLEMPLRVGVIQASSYRGEAVRGPLVINSDLMLDIAGRDVVLVDDIFDTGHTLTDVVAVMEEFSPRSVHTAVLLRKQGRQQVDWAPDFIGFDIPDQFVVGYGLDFRDAYRNLPYVAALEPEEVA